MPPVGLESAISVLERAKTVRALDRAATAIGKNAYEAELFVALLFYDLLLFIGVGVPNRGRKI
jgi:hypothetical protein